MNTHLTVRRRLIGSRERDSTSVVPLRTALPYVSVRRARGRYGARAKPSYNLAALLFFPPMIETPFCSSHPRACHFSRDGDASATRSTFSSHCARFFHLVVAPIIRADRMQVNTIAIMLTLMYYFCMYNGSIKIDCLSLRLLY